ncbi:class I SAM-dependent methyltransferase [Eubacteriaceae bacterium ES3]|nr:class I SAM-dependent methyltransferase [Eubacteriaceae bacterium ES3]
MNETLNYYNQTAKDFVDDTVSADLTDIHQRFLNYLPQKATILDLGCGSGRDAKAFIEAGYTVTAVDGAEECCKLAQTLIGRPVSCLIFDQIDYEQEFDGVWACASLLHVPFDDLPDIFDRIVKALKPGGSFYASFKYGDYEGMRRGRYFTDLNEERLEELLKKVEGLKIVETFLTGDARVGREDEQWFNLVGEKERIK